jgi:uncharacterized membrane protein YraQ (UPF0718 family)
MQERRVVLRLGGRTEPVREAGSSPSLAPQTARRRTRLFTAALLVPLVVVGLGSRGLVADFFAGSAAQLWSTLLVSIVIQALPFLVLGVLISGAIAALVPPGWLAGDQLLAAPCLGLLAAALARSEADAFVAASLRQFSLSARLVFLVVGPAVDPSPEPSSVRRSTVRGSLFGCR